MKIKQLSVFLENKPGRLSELCALLAENEINIITLSLADTEQFGILRLIVLEHEQAKELLNANGFLAKITDVIAICVKDEAGGLSSILKLEKDAGISVEYMYAFTSKSGEDAILLFRFADMDKAVDALASSDIQVLDRGMFHALTTK